MNKRWVTSVLSIAMYVVSVAIYSQQPAASTNSPQPVSSSSITGPIVQVEISGDVDAKKAHPGDIFRTKVWEDVRSGDKVILPQKTILVGHVVAAQPRTKDNPESKLTIVFDKAILKDGSEIPIRGVVERVELSPMAVAAATDTNSPSYNPGLNRGSTTNIAMPNQTVNEEAKQIAPGPTNIRDSSIALQSDASGTTTVLTSTAKTDLKLKHYATLDVRVTHIGQ